MFRGSMTALITPMHEDGSVDEAGFQKFVQWQIDEGTDGVIPMGTTGESPTVSHAEHERVVDLCIEVAKGKVPVIAGTGSNNTAEAISLTRHAKDAGADAALVVTPYYNKPTQDGLYAHFAAIAKAVDIPIVIYNIPGRSIIDMSVATMARLAKDFDNIVGVKDATADLSRPLKTRVAIGEDFSQLSGEDATVAAFLAQGGHGCISVSSNVAPGLCARLHDSWQQKDWATFEEVRDRLMPVHDAMFCQSSPAPAKYGASLLGLSSETVRLPLVSATAETKAQVRAAMESAGLV
ncbi:4-hydroxy-tetrahydrodipicolinate synthase [Rhodospirillaceae bacterium KN72]|uniref:4-hydroxy-tetrahydrodipicolinate synthase n=1 Tax=Pacificispira spongiicola TaxID=2729598 RepID=A0A7Y0DZ00_9PROT|nr:4-hydroxy-tetrahydrodipicolinate synthase [Pacificispira spongiicola]NMM44188.1 4-hydroxy-tetrahydrodipicolinate synthase [Pacificispira spongiicola]